MAVIQFELTYNDSFELRDVWHHPCLCHTQWTQQTNGTHCRLSPSGGNMTFHMTSSCSLTAKCRLCVFFRNMLSSWYWSKRDWREICNYGWKLYSNQAIAWKHSALHYAPELWLIGVFLICTESTDNNLVHRVWLALKFDYHSPEQIGGLLWVSEWSKNANSGDEVAAVSPKFNFKIYLSRWIHSWSEIERK